MEPSITAGEVLDLIRRRAYAMWEAEGRPEERAVQHWLAAEADVLAEVDQSGATGRKDANAAAHVLHDDANASERQDELLDEAIEETFPASDPIAPKRIT